MKYIYIHTDPSFELNSKNVFLSLPYFSDKEFLKENQDFQILARYDVGKVLGAWGLPRDLSLLKSLSGAARSMAKKIKSEFKKTKSFKELSEGFSFIDPTVNLYEEFEEDINKILKS